MILTRFWENIPHSDRVKIYPTNLYEFLTQNGFRYITIGEERIAVPVKINGKIITKIKMYDLLKFTIDSVRDADEIYELSGNEKQKIIDALTIPNGFFSGNKVYLLKEIIPNYLKDTKEKSYVFFMNRYCEISKDGIVLKEYDELEVFINADDIIDFMINDVILMRKAEEGEFYKFLTLICKGNNEANSIKNLESLRSIIGYMLHRYKDPGFSKAVILMDEDYSDNPEGGTGKGILTNA